MNGVAWTNTGDAEDYGTIAIDTDQTYTFRNDGNVDSGAITITWTPTTGSYWDATISDTCDGNTVTQSNSCSVTVRFKTVSGAPPSGTHTGTLDISEASGAQLTLNLQATK